MKTLGGGTAAKPKKRPNLAEKRAIIKGIQERRAQGRAPGAGLAAAMKKDERAGALKAPTEELAGVKMYNPATLRRSPFNREIDEEDPDFIKLVADVKENGVLQNGIIRPASDPKNPKIIGELIAGEGRWEACKRSKRMFPAAMQDVDDTRAIELQAIENMKRRNLNPIDEAIKYQQLRDRYIAEERIGRTEAIAKLCEMTGKAESTIAERLSLLDLPEQVVTLIKKRDLPPSHAALLTKLSDPQTAIRLAKEITTAPPAKGTDGLLGFRESKELVAKAVTKEKNLAKWQKEKVKFLAAGLRVLTDGENAALLEGNEHSDWWRIKDGTKLIRTGYGCSLPGANYRNWEEMWKKEPPEILGRTPYGLPVIVYDYAQACEAVKAGGKLKKSGTSSSSSNSSEAVTNRNHRRRVNEFKAIVPQVVAVVETTLDSAQFWQLFANTLVRQWRSEPLTRLAKRRGWTRDLEDTVIQAEIGKMGVQELRGLCFEILLYGSSPSSYSSGWGTTLKEVCSLFKIPLPSWSGKAEGQTSGEEEEHGD